MFRTTSTPACHLLVMCYSACMLSSCVRYGLHTDCSPGFCLYMLRAKGSAVAAWHSSSVFLFSTGEQNSSYDSFRHAAGHAGLACQDNVPYTTGTAAKLSHSLTLRLWQNMHAFDLLQLISLRVVSRYRTWHITHSTKKNRNVYLAAGKGCVSFMLIHKG